MADSALKRQVLGEIAKAAGLGGDELARAWRSAERRRKAAWSAPSPAQHPLAGGTRPAPAAAADLALRLLLRNAQWWERLAAEDHQLLHGLAGIHGEAIAWLEQQITEHGPVTWPALEQLLGDHPLRAAARAWVHAGSIDESNTFEELHNVVVRLRIEQLREEAQQVARTPVTERSQLERLRQLHEQIKQLHASLSATG
jgi:DNA primase